MQWDRLVPGKIRPDLFETKRMKAAAQILRPCTCVTTVLLVLLNTLDQECQTCQVCSAEELTNRHVGRMAQDRAADSRKEVSPGIACSPTVATVGSGALARRPCRVPYATWGHVGAETALGAVCRLRTTTCMG